jgi:8-oxo-dGTP pyrophosphatase MutT (NUDIX family)
MVRYTDAEELKWHNSLPSKRIAASVILRNKNGEILVVKPNYRDYWNLPGGVVEPNESPTEGVIRESKEEVGIVLQNSLLKLIAIDYIHERPDGRKDSIYFEFDGGTLSDDQIANIKLQESELDEFRFISVGDTGQFLSKWKSKRIQLALNANQPAILLEDGISTSSV